MWWRRSGPAMARVLAAPGGRAAGGGGSDAAGGGDPVLHHGSVVAVGTEGRAVGWGDDMGADSGVSAALLRGVLITGASGSGKSALALALMASGARLVADDGVLLCPRDGRLVATCPAALSGLIEARGVGLLRAWPLAEAEIVLVVDLDQVETERLPHRRTATLAGIALPCLHKVEAAYFPAAILQYLKGSRVEP